MINKKNLWFLTLTSIILVLAIYYVTMPLGNDNMVLNSNNNNNIFAYIISLYIRFCKKIYIHLIAIMQ